MAKIDGRTKAAAAAQILKRTQEDGKDGQLEGFKTGEGFNATSRNSIG